MNQEEKDNDRLIEQGWRGWLSLYGYWTIPAVAMASGFFWSQPSSEVRQSWESMLINFLVFYYALASICPALYRLCHRRIILHKGLFKLILANLLLCALLIIAITIISDVMYVLISDETISLSKIIQLVTESHGFSVNRTFIIVFWYGVALGSMIIIKLQRQRQWQEEKERLHQLHSSKLETQISQLKLKILKSQLRPHFLFNALNSISSLVQTGHPDSAYDAIGRLGALLRKSLNLPDSNEVTLREELSLTTSYLEIEKLRFADRLNLELQIPENCLDINIPSLILQPLIENCIKHGLSNSEEPVTISIIAKVCESTLVLDVQDDGPGLPSHWSMNGGGIGLQNIQDQLQTLYGDDFNLKITSRSPNGVNVRVRIPVGQEIVRNLTSNQELE